MAGKQIVITGPGAIGCLLAGMAQQAGNDVWLLDKDTARASEITNNGLIIENGEEVINIKVKATVDPANIPPPDFLFISVKSFDTESAISHALPLLTKDTIIVTMQNGYGNAKKIYQLTNSPNIVCVITAHGATILGSGHVRHAGTGKTSAAAFSPDGIKYAQKVADLLSACAIETNVVADKESMLWSKLIINAAINPLTGLNAVKNGELLNDANLRSAMHLLVKEAAGVALVQGIKLIYDNAEAETESICKRTSNNFSSMCQDMRNNKKTEIESISGEIVRIAEQQGISAPANRMMLELVLWKEKNP